MVPATSIVAALRRRTAAFASLIAQVCVGLAVISHALMVGDLFRRQGRGPGVDTPGMFAVVVESARPRPDGDLRALRSIEGVRAVAWTAFSPFFPRTGTPEMLAAGDRSANAWAAAGSASLQQTLSWSLSEGRALTDADAIAAGPLPVLVSADLARQLFGQGSAVGRTLRGVANGREHVVVGVLQRAMLVPEFFASALFTEIRPVRPFLDRRAEFVVRVDPQAAARFPAAAEAALRAVDPDRAIRIETSRHLRDRRYNTRPGTLSLLGAIIALVLSVVLLGSIGMASFLVSERKREIGMRRALGASRTDIVAHFVVETALVTGIGLALGTALAMAFNQLVVRWLPIGTLDFHHLFLGIILLLATSLAAAAVPALRAARVPPSTASKAI